MPGGANHLAKIYLLSSILMIVSSYFFYYIIKVKYKGIKSKSDNKEPLFPLDKKIVTSKFGFRIHPKYKIPKFHNGTDYAGKTGDKIYASDDGIVIDKFYNNAGGNQLIIQYPNLKNLKFGYAHLNKIYVEKGEKVKRGQVIAEVGNTGVSTGPHLHLTIKDSNGIYIDSESIFA